MATIPPVVITGPSPNESFASRPDEGSIAEKEYPHPATAGTEKWPLSAAEKPTSADRESAEAGEYDDLEKSRSFFSPQGVEKELRDLGLDAARSREEVSDDDLR